MKQMKMIISLLIFMIVICIVNISNAGLEVKEGTTPYVNVNVSESFDICYNLRDGTSTLGTCELDPHMATSLDWGAVVYLAHSRYGANSSSLDTNTTGNKSGVMNMYSFGYSTQTATIFKDRSTTSSNATTYRYRLDEAANDPNLNKYVDEIDTTLTVGTTKGRAIAETYTWYNKSYIVSTNLDMPVMLRDSGFGLLIGNPYYEGSGLAGQNRQNVTFRPIIWN